MTTLIAVYSSGGCEGRCDARCYNAKEPSCTCVCGGKNHGVGMNQAIENTRELAEEWIEAYTKEKKFDYWWSKVNLEPSINPGQLELLL